jgi:hypothetical protein
MLRFFSQVMEPESAVRQLPHHNQHEQVRSGYPFLSDLFSASALRLPVRQIGLSNVPENASRACQNRRARRRLASLIRTHRASRDALLATQVKRHINFSTLKF